MDLDFSTPEALTTAAGFLMSLIFVIWPSARRWFTEKDADTQAAINGGIILLVATLGVVGGCTGIIPTQVACTQDNIVNYAVRIVFASVLGVGANRSVFLVARKLNPAARATAKALETQPPAPRPKLLD